MELGCQPSEPSDIVSPVCSPTRAALLSGRLPIHVNQKNSAEWGWTAAAAHPKFTLLPARLASTGYISHQLGKWHLAGSNR